MARVLIVDDEPSVRRALRGFLERSGLAVVEAESADRALEILEHDAPVDAVVSDVLMPGVSGIAFYDRLVTVAPELATRVVFLTGAAQNPEVHTRIEQRGVPLVSKLDDLRLVVDAVRWALLRRVP